MKAGTILLREDGFLYMVIPVEHDYDNHIMCLNNSGMSKITKLTSPVMPENFETRPRRYAIVGEIEWADIAASIDKDNLEFLHLKKQGHTTMSLKPGDIFWDGGSFCLVYRKFEEGKEVLHNIRLCDFTYGILSDEVLIAFASNKFASNKDIYNISNINNILKEIVGI